MNRPRTSARHRKRWWNHAGRTCAASQRPARVSAAVSVVFCVAALLAALAPEDAMAAKGRGRGGESTTTVTPASTAVSTAPPSIAPTPTPAPAPAPVVSVAAIVIPPTPAPPPPQPSSAPLITIDLPIPTAPPPTAAPAPTPTTPALVVPPPATIARSVPLPIITVKPPPTTVPRRVTRSARCGARTLTVEVSGASGKLRVRTKLAPRTAEAWNATVFHDRKIAWKGKVRRAELDYRLNDYVGSDVIAVRLSNSTGGLCVAELVLPA